jgi:putative flippase GtrA
MLGVVARSLGVGLVASACDLALLTALIQGLDVSARHANAPGLLLGAVVQFAGNKWLAFRDPSPRWVAQGTAFALVQGAAMVLQWALFDRLVIAGLHFAWARIASTAAVYFAFSLPLWSRIFRARASRETP